MLFVRICVLAALVVGLAPASAEAAAPAFTPSTAPVPADAAARPDASVGDTACLAGGDCVAVGAYTDAAGGTSGLLIRRAAAGTTTAATAPVPADSATLQRTGLASVSCVADATCTAVGSYTDSKSRYAGLIETRTNGVWHARRAPNPVEGAARYLVLEKVACGSSCAAIGNAIVGQKYPAVILSNLGGSWKAQPVTMPAGTTLASVSDVACPAFGSCAAIGRASNGRAVLLYSSTGGWKSLYLAAPAGAPAELVQAGALTCSSDGNCVVLGTYTNTDDQYALIAENIDHGVLTAVDVPFPGAGVGFYDTVLTGVACWSDGNCVGTGNSRGNGPFLLRRTNGTWTARRAALPSDLDTGSTELPHLFGVACSAAATCVAVGYYPQLASGRSRLFTESLSGNRWTVAKLGKAPGLPGDVTESLSGVSCSAAGCLASGYYAHFTDGTVDYSGGLLGYRAA